MLLTPTHTLPQTATNSQQRGNMIKLAVWWFLEWRGERCPELDRFIPIIVNMWKGCRSVVGGGNQNEGMNLFEFQTYWLWRCCLPPISLISGGNWSVIFPDMRRFGWWIWQGQHNPCIVLQLAFVESIWCLPWVFYSFSAEEWMGWMMRRRKPW